MIQGNITKEWKNKATTVIPLSKLGPGGAGGLRVE